MICLLKFKVGIESEFDKNESNKNFKAKFYFLNNSNDVNTVKEVCCQKNIWDRQTNKLIIHAKYFVYKKDLWLHNKRQRHFSNCVLFKNSGENCRKKTIVVIYRWCKSLYKRTKKEVQLSLYCNFLRVKWKQKRFISLSEKC